MPARSELSARIPFSAPSIDRQSERRDDVPFMASRLADPTALTTVVVRDTPVLARSRKGVDPFFTIEEAAALGPALAQGFLGETRNGPVFATLLDDRSVICNQDADAKAFLDTRTMRSPLRDDLIFTDMRSLLTQGGLDEETVALVGQGKSLLSWHARHAFCSSCGAPSRIVSAGWRRDCDTCNAQHFPRTDPVAIMLAYHGDQCLMGRQPRFPRGMFSCLAGFIEPGETIEDAVRRELFEEAGIAVGRVDYAASQPWPFPGSLMIGCLAQSLGRDLKIDTHELEDARWFSRDEALAMIAGRHPGRLFCPPPTAIAHHLLAVWAREEMAVAATV